MNQPLDAIIGNKFGKLLVLSYFGRDSGRGKLYKCLCDCGKETVTYGTLIRQGRSKSCGCGSGLKPEKDRRFALLKILFSQLKARAKPYHRKIDFDFNYFCDIVGENCFYCGEEPSNILKDVLPSSNYALRYSGIDRIDSNTDYIKGNVVPCCIHCNIFKLDRGIENFLSYPKGVIENFKIENEEDIERLILEKLIIWQNAFLT